MPKANNDLFNIYYLYYKEKLINNSIETLIYATNYLLCNLSNLLIAYFLIYDSSIYIALPNLVIKKRKLSKTFLSLFSHPL